MNESIALFSPSLRAGGAERVMLNLACEFSRRQIPVDMVLAKAEGQYLKQLPSNVRVIDFDSKEVLGSLPGLIRYLRQEKPLVLLATQMHANVIALISRRLAGVTTKLFVREANIVTLPSIMREVNLRARIALLLARFCYPWANGVIAVSNGVADSLSRSILLARDKIDVIYNPVVRPELFSGAKAAVTHPWFTENEIPVILSVGRLAEQKDFATLIRAFQIVRKQMPARLVILGDGDKRYFLESLVKTLEIDEDVSLPGVVDNPYGYMARSAVYVLSSVWEGLPNTLIEAMAIGVPVVATDCESGPREILADGRYGQIVPVGDEQAIADGILKVLNGQETSMPGPDALKPFYLEECVDKYLKVLQCGRSAL